ncbi:MAG: DUF1413 domain-containing protein [Clostridium sp.]
MITKSTPVANLFSEAVRTLSELESGETFVVSHLFRVFEWERIEVSNRATLGSMFFRYVNNDGLGIVTLLDKSSEGQQRYKKI